MTLRPQYTSVTSTFPFFSTARREFEHIKTQIGTTEPELDWLAQEIHSRLRTRQSPFHNLPIPPVRNTATALEIKTLLLLLDPTLITTILTKPLSVLLDTDAMRIPFPDPSKDYPGVYFGGYLNVTDAQPRELTNGDLLRITNILIKPERVDAVLAQYEQFLPHSGANYSAVCNEIGRRMEKLLQGERNVERIGCVDGRS